MMLCLLPVVAYAQSISVSGTVVDEMGEPIPGANVLQKGTTNGVLTDIDGNFSLKAPSGATLVVSYIGYLTKEVPAAAKVNVVLQEDNKMLDDVVVIGYGTARRSDLTGSIASMSSDALREVPSSDITQSLQGRVAGVDLTTTNSQPGASMQIRIRGQRSLTASNDPLIVLDGIPFMGDLNDISPSSIKSMDILKDAASTAIYGARGANGVIMITTFKGAIEQPATVKYSGYVGFQNAVKYPMMTGAQLEEVRRIANIYTDGEKPKYGLDEKAGLNTDWQDLFYKTGIITNHDLQVAGGTKGGSYNIGLGYHTNKGVVPTQEFTRYNLSANFDQKVGKFVRIGITTNTNYSVTEGSQIGLYGVISASPLVNPYNEDGTFKRAFQSVDDQSWTMTKQTLEGVEESWLSHTTNLGSYNSAFAEISQPWIEGLTYRVNVGANYKMNKNGSFTGTGVNAFLDTNPNGASLRHTETLNWTVENLLTYDNTFAEKHHLNVVGMYSAEQTTFQQSYISGQKIPADYFQYFNIGYAELNLAVPTGSQLYNQSGLMSWMGRAMYTYDDKYMLSVALRSDASSRLAAGHKWHTYPAVSAGWNINKEKFMDDVEWLDQLKVRVGYGETSNQSISPYSTLGRLSTRYYNFGDDYQKGYYVTQLPNPDLGWEYSQTWNYGLDFSLFNGRLSGTFEYYTQSTRDLLLGVNLPSTSGVSSYTANVGETSNKGFELSINGTIIENKDWKWTAGINLYHNHNELVALASGNKEDIGNGWFVGHPIDVIYDYKKVGIWQQGEEELMKILQPDAKVGSIRVEYTGEYDANGKPTRAISEDDRQVMELEPALMGGFNTNLSWKGLDLNVVGSFKVGGKMVSTLYGSSGYLNMLNGRRGNVDVDYWTPQNTGADFPSPDCVRSDQNPKYGTTLGYFDAGYFKIRSITLGYTVAPKAIKKAGFKSLRAYATIQNPFTFSKYTSMSGQDPEPNAMSGNGQFNATTFGNAGHGIPVVGTNAPFTRNFIFGVDLSF